jgi:hypothetical protein
MRRPFVMSSEVETSLTIVPGNVKRFESPAVAAHPLRLDFARNDKADTPTITERVHEGENRA